MKVFISNMNPSRSFVVNEKISYPQGYLNYRDPNSVAKRYERLNEQMEKNPLKFLNVERAVKLGFEKDRDTQIVDKFEECDLLVSWGWSDPNNPFCTRPKFERGHRDVLVLELGYIGNRHYWTSASFNGLNGSGELHNAYSPGDRWNRYFGELVKPWRLHNDGYFLIVGQLQGDANVTGLDLESYYCSIYEKCSRLRKTYFKPHPRQPYLFEFQKSKGVHTLTGDIRKAVQGAYCTVGISSNSLVDSVLMGTPGVSLDPRSMAWAVTSHDIKNLLFPDRTQWLYDLAYRQWSPYEIADGTMWEFLKKRYTQKQTPRRIVPTSSEHVRP